MYSVRAAGFATAHPSTSGRVLSSTREGCANRGVKPPPPSLLGLSCMKPQDPWVLRRKSHLGALGLRPNSARRHPVSTAHLRQGRTAEANDYGTSTM